MFPKGWSAALAPMGIRVAIGLLVTVIGMCCSVSFLFGWRARALDASVCDQQTPFQTVLWSYTNLNYLHRRQANEIQRWLHGFGFDVQVVDPNAMSAITQSIKLASSLLHWGANLKLPMLL